MAFSLKKLLTQDLNPFDGPKKPQPASTAQPTTGGLSVGVARPQQGISVATTAPQPKSIVQAPVLQQAIPRVQLAPTQTLKVGNQAIPNTTSVNPNAAPIQRQVSNAEKIGAFSGGLLSSAAKAGADTIKATTDLRFVTPNFLPGSQALDRGINKVSTTLSAPLEQARQGVDYLNNERGYNGAQATKQAMSAGNVVGTGAVYAPQVVAGVQGAVQAVKAIPKVIEGAGNVGRATTKLIRAADERAFTPRVNLNDQAVLRDYSDYLAGANKAQGTELNQLITQAREVGARNGIDLTNGSPESRLQGSNSILDQIGTSNKQVAQGGYIQKPTGFGKTLEDAGIAPKVTTPDGRKARGFTENLATSKAAQDPDVQAVIEAIPGYTPVKNKNTLKRAEQRVSKDASSEYARIVTKPQLDTADDVATSNVLLRNAIESGDTEAAIQIGTKLGVDGTKLGQAIQAYSTWKKTTPEGIVTYASKQAARAGKNLETGVTDDLIARAKTIAAMPEGFEKAQATQELLGSADKLGRKWTDVAGEILAAPRALMATADFSAPLRQGAILGSRYPKQFGKAFAESAKYMFKPEYYKREMYELTQRPSYPLMKNSGLSVDAGENLTGTEEQFLSNVLEGKIAKKLGVGHVIAASDRAYSGFLTKLRADVFDSVMKDAAKAGVKYNRKEVQSLSKFINSASGRGDGNLTRQVSKLQVLFSARLWKSRLDTLNPVYYARLDPQARKLALQSAASFAAVTGTLLGLAKLAGASVNNDPRSADFGKIKVGDTRYDVLGGLQQNIRLGAQLATGQKVNSSTGEVQTLGADRGFGKPSRLDLGYQFLENKENPLIALGTKALRGTDQIGQPVNLGTEAAKLAIPLNAQGVYSTAKDTGSLPKSIAMNTPGVFGIGVQTYGTGTPKPTKSADGDKTVTADTIKAGNKEKSAALKKSLSKDDLAISQLSKKDQQKLVASGAYSQDKIDGLNSYVKSKRIELGLDEPTKVDTPKTKYDTALKSFNDTQAKLSGPDRVKKQKELTTLKAKSNFDSDIVDLYDFSKADLYNYVSKDPNGKAIVDKLLKLDDALVATGATSKLRDKYGNLLLNPPKDKATAAKKASNTKYAASLATMNKTASSNASALRDIVGKQRISSSKQALKKTKVALKKGKNVKIKPRTA